MGPSDKFLGLRGSADGLLGLGLMTPPSKTILATPASPWLASVFVGSTLSAVPAVTGAPSNSTWLNAGDPNPTTRGGVTMGTPVAPSANDANGGDGFGYWYFGGGGEAFEIVVPNGNRTVYALFGVNGGYSHSCRVFNGDPTGSPAYTMPATSSIDGSHRADLSGVARADATVFSTQVGVPITVTNGKISIFVNSDFFLNWVGIQ